MTYAVYVWCVQDDNNASLDENLSWKFLPVIHELEFVWWRSSSIHGAKLNDTQSKKERGERPFLPEFYSSTRNFGCWIDDVTLSLSLLGSFLFLLWLSTLERSLRTAADLLVVDESRRVEQQDEQRRRHGLQLPPYYVVGTSLVVVEQVSGKAKQSKAKLYTGRMLISRVGRRCRRRCSHIHHSEPFCRYRLFSLSRRTNLLSSALHFLLRSLTHSLIRPWFTSLCRLVGVGRPQRISFGEVSPVELLTLLSCCTSNQCRWRWWRRSRTPVLSRFFARATRTTTWTVLPSFKLRTSKARFNQRWSSSSLAIRAHLRTWLNRLRYAFRFDADLPTHACAIERPRRNADTHAHKHTNTHMQTRT